MRCGIDSVEIARCRRFLSTQRWVQRIFTPAEQEYIRASPAQSLERIAGRFAAKEAVFKAINPMIRIPFLAFCKSCEIVPGPYGPSVQFTGPLAHLSSQKIALSITHTHELAIACAIMPNID
jgi:holo-[acyl-carrier protein] synthase